VKKAPFLFPQMGERLGIRLKYISALKGRHIIAQGNALWGKWKHQVTPSVKESFSVQKPSFGRNINQF